jgi:hypothetical protein
MTCIVGYLYRDTVYLGGDSAGTDDSFSQQIRKDPKVFSNGPFIFGFTSSFRMGQLLMSSKFQPWEQNPNQSDYDYMVTDFIDSIRKLFKKGGYLQKNSEGDEIGGTFLVGYKGVLYYVEDDFQIGIIETPYLSIGCGCDLALGSMYTSVETLGGEQQIRKHHINDILTKALEASSKFSAGCKPPFNFVSMSKHHSEEIAKNLKPKPIPLKKK